MLTRIGADRSSAPTGQRTQIVSRSRNNNGVNDARFEYDGVVLPRETVQGLPACTFTIVPATKTFEAVVDFDPGAPSTARYDLFEVDPSGGLIDLQEDAFPVDPLINFGISFRTRGETSLCYEAHERRGARFNDTAFWIMMVDKEVIDDHGDIWNRTFVEMLGELMAPAGFFTPGTRLTLIRTQQQVTP